MHWSPVMCFYCALTVLHCSVKMKNWCYLSRFQSFFNSKVCQFLLLKTRQKFYERINYIIHYHKKFSLQFIVHFQSRKSDFDVTGHVLQIKKSKDVYFVKCLVCYTSTLYNIYTVLENSFCFTFFVFGINPQNIDFKTGISHLNLLSISSLILRI